MNVSPAAPCPCAQSSEPSKPVPARADAKYNTDVDRYAMRGLRIGAGAAVAIGFGVTASYAASQGATLPQMFDEFLLPTIVLTTIYSTVAAAVAMPVGLIGGVVTGVVRNRRS